MTYVIYGSPQMGIILWTIFVTKSQLNASPIGEGPCCRVGRGSGLADPEAEAVRRRAAPARHLLRVVHGVLDGTLS